MKLKFLFFLFGIFFGFISPQSLKADVISSNDFQLIGPDGKVSARLCTSSDGTPGLFLMDSQGKSRLVLSLYPDGMGGISLNDEKERSVAILRLHGSHMRPVLVLKHDGMDKMVIGLKDDDTLAPYFEPLPISKTENKEPSGFPPIMTQILVAGLFGFIGGKFSTKKS